VEGKEGGNEEWEADFGCSQTLRSADDGAAFPRFARRQTMVVIVMMMVAVSLLLMATTTTAAILRANMGTRQFAQFGEVGAKEAGNPGTETP
jgi:hypothetical protein